MCSCDPWDPCAPPAFRLLVSLGDPPVNIIFLRAGGLIGWGRESFWSEQLEQMGSEVILYFIMSAQVFLADVTSILVYRNDTEFVQKGPGIL
jgi:hypothetical protein